jgi:hypothetical protein
LTLALVGLFTADLAFGFFEEEGRRAINILAVAIRVLFDPSPAFPQSAFLIGNKATSWPSVARPKDGAISARLCPGHPRLAVMPRRGYPAQGRA